MAPGSMHCYTNKGALLSLRYCTYAGDERAIITTAPPPVTLVTQNHKGYVVPYLAISCLSMSSDTYDHHRLIIGLPSYSTDVL